MDDDLLKRKEQFKMHLEASGIDVSQNGRVKTCPGCGAINSAQIYDDGKIVCFKTGCKINSYGSMDYDEYIAVFGDEFLVELTDVHDLKVKMEKEIVVNKNINHEIFLKAIDFFHDELMEGGKEYKTLIDRGRTDESIKHFKVGLVQNWDKLHNRLSKNYSIDQLEDCGLFRYQDDGTPLVKLNFGGYCYPIYWNGKIRTIKSKIADNGMYIGKRYTGDDYQMFLNSAGLKESEVILVEGENDAMCLWEMGKKNTVAILGQLSNKQLTYLKGIREDKIFYLCFDNDTAGESYTKKFIKSFKSVKRHQVFTIPYKGDDPDVGSDFEWEGLSSLIIQAEIKKIEDEEIEKGASQFKDLYVKVEVGSNIVYASKKYRNQWLNYMNLAEKHINEIKSLQKWRQNNTEVADHGVCCNYSTTDYIVNDQFNMFEGFKVKPVKSELPVKWLYFVKKVICNNNYEYFQYFMDWLSDLFQNPNLSTAIVMVVISEQGAGKQLLVEPIKRIIGDMYSTRIDNVDNIFGQYNEAIENKLFANLDEVTFGKSKKEQGRLKSLTGNSTIMINGKYRPTYTIDFSCRFIVTSNDFIPVGIEEGDRRFFVLEASDEYIGKKSYYDPIWQEIDDPQKLEALMYYFKHRKIDPTYNRFVVKDTIYKKDMVSEILDSVGQWLAEVEDGLAFGLSDWNSKVQNNKVAIKDLHSSYILWYDENLSNSKYEERLTIKKFSLLMRKKYWKNKEYKTFKQNNKSVKGFEL